MVGLAESASFPAAPGMPTLWMPQTSSTPSKPTAIDRRARWSGQTGTSTSCCKNFRVAQTGVQILFAFLLTLVFQQRFADITEVQRWTYVVTWLLSVVTAGLLVAPAAVHRFTFQRGLKMETVLLGHRLFTVGLAMLAVTLAGGVLLVFGRGRWKLVCGPGGPRVPAPVAFAVVLVAVAAAAATARTHSRPGRAAALPATPRKRGVDVGTAETMQRAWSANCAPTACSLTSTSGPKAASTSPTG